MPQIREQIAMVHLPPSKTLKYLFHVRKTKCGDKKDVSCEKPDYIGLFCYPNGDFSLYQNTDCPLFPVSL